MANKNKRKVDVVSTLINNTSLFTEHSVSFIQIIKNAEGKNCTIGVKTYEVHLLDFLSNDIYIGWVETMHNKNLPPKKDKKTKKLSDLGLNPEQESLVFANIFLYDVKSNLFLYEVNGNGCYLETFKDVTKSLWDKNPDNQTSRFNIEFPIVPRIDQYKKILSMNYYKRYFIEIYNPKELVKGYEQDNLGVKEVVKGSSQLNADILKIEQYAVNKKINPKGLDRYKLLQSLDIARNLVNSDNIVTLKVEGYTQDPESSNTLKSIDLIANTYNDCYFCIEGLQIQKDLQIQERKDGILEVYKTIIKEISEKVSP